MQGKLPTVNTASSWDIRVQQIKLVLGKKVYQELIANLQSANDLLDKIRQHALELESSNKSKQFRSPLQKLRRLRDRASHLFASLSNSQRWSCSCDTIHALLLRMATNRESTKKDPPILVSFTDLPSNVSKPRNRGWQTCEVKDANANAQNPPLRNAKVGFKSATNMTQQSQKEIDCLCGFLSNTWQRAFSLGDCVGHISASNGATNRLELFWADNYQSVHTVSLSSAICNMRDCPRQVSGLELEVNDRLSLAANLASSAFELQGNRLDNI